MVKSLCERIKELREDHDLTQFQVAEILGCAKYTYQRYEYGDPRTHQRGASLSPSPVNACFLFTVCAGPLVLCQKASTSRFHRVSPIHSSIILPNVIIFDKKTEISQYILCFPPVFVSKCVWAAVAALQNPPVCFISMYGCGQTKKPAPCFGAGFVLRLCLMHGSFYGTAPCRPRRLLPKPAARSTAQAGSNPQSLRRWRRWGWPIPGSPRS